VRVRDRADQRVVEDECSEGENCKFCSQILAEESEESEASPSRQDEIHPGRLWSPFSEVDSEAETVRLGSPRSAFDLPDASRPIPESPRDPDASRVQRPPKVTVILKVTGSPPRDITKWFPFTKKDTLRSRRRVRTYLNRKGYTRRKPVTAVATVEGVT
jgi:hypothetical protein